MVIRIDIIVFLADFVQKLNSTMYDHVEILPGIMFEPFEVSSNGEVTAVSFLGQQIWRSNDSTAFEMDQIKEEILQEANKALESLKLMEIKKGI